MIRLKPTSIPGCHEVLPFAFDDIRGRFVKVFHRGEFLDIGLEADFAEEYYSISRKGVIRGMHFQTPPCDHVKMVYCVSGEVLDVVVDLRRGSPSFGQAATFSLSAESGNCIYIPKGMAHGFCVMSETAILVYKVSTVYSQECDTGILWNSVGVDWPVVDPVISERDRSFVSLTDFKSPFVYA